MLRHEALIIRDKASFSISFLLSVTLCSTIRNSHTQQHTLRSVLRACTASFDYVPNDNKWAIMGGKRGTKSFLSSTGGRLGAPRSPYCQHHSPKWLLVLSFSHTSMCVLTEKVARRAPQHQTICQLRSPHWFSQFYQIKPHGCIFEPSHISISILHSKRRFWNMNNHFKNQLHLKPEDQLKCEWSHFGVTIYINSSQSKSQKLHSFRLTKALSTVLAYSLDLSNLLLYYHNPQTCTQMLFVLFESLVLKSEGK